ncbi:MAG: hypothetical protein IKF90_12145 [Parasporobacterium sp.]|nr:hypothetical protein [Parasporobacterium sp.]
MKTREKIRLRILLEQYLNETGSKEAGKLIQILDGTLIIPAKAGRKPKYSDETVRVIKNLRANGETIRSIAAVTGCSTGYVQKIAAEQETGQSKTVKKVSE